MPITENDLADLLTPVDAARFLDVSRSTIYRMIENEEIDVVRVGSGRGRLRITKRSLLDNLNRSVTPAKANKSRSRSRPADQERASA